MPRAGLRKIVRYSGEFNLISPPRGMNPVGRPKGRAAPLPFGNPMAKDPEGKTAGNKFQGHGCKTEILARGADSRYCTLGRQSCHCENIRACPL